ncbi:MAG TPA: tetratricopeptide repeat protein [Verrucomicrobiae bacterium]|nr:tetratricopeptide repeat protein [Verrucomicrobiae bacterium]
MFRARALSYYYISNYDDALRDMTECLRFEKDNPGNYGLRGSFSEVKGDLTNAIADYTRDLELSPKDLRAHGSRGHAYLKEQHFDEAIDDFNVFLQVHPANVEILLYRRWAFQNQEEWGKAIDDFNVVIRYVSNNVALYRDRAIDERQNGEVDAAIQDFKQALRLKPGDRAATTNLLSISEAAQKAKNELVTVNAMLARNPTNATALGNQGYIFEEEGEFEKATNDFTRALELNPNHVANLNHFAWLLATAPDPQFRDGKRAVELASQACTLTHWKSRGYIDTLAAAYAEAGDFDAAIKYSDLALVSPELMPARKTETETRLKLYQRHKAHHAALIP